MSSRSASPELNSDHEEHSRFFTAPSSTTKPQPPPELDEHSESDSTHSQEGTLSFSDIIKSTKPSPQTTPFQQKVYALLMQIPPGRVTTYALLSAALKSSPRAVGGALKRNPYAPRVPCHRVVAANGFLGGFFGEWKKSADGVMGKRKLELLRDEGVRFDGKGYLVERRRIWGAFEV